MRRIVTGTGADGRSLLVSDGEPVRIFRNPSSPDRQVVTAAEADPAKLGADEVAVAELWATDTVPPLVDGHDPTADMEWSRDMPPGGTRWRVVVMGPNREAAMHRTPSIDYDVLLSGSLVLVLDDSEVALTPGDLVVLPGTRHGWRAGPDGATLLVSMVGL